MCFAKLGMIMHYAILGTIMCYAILGTIGLMWIKSSIYPSNNVCFTFIVCITNNSTQIYNCVSISGCKVYFK